MAPRLKRQVSGQSKGRKPERPKCLCHLHKLHPCKQSTEGLSHAGVCAWAVPLWQLQADSRKPFGRQPATMVVVCPGIQGMGSQPEMVV